MKPRRHAMDSASPSRRQYQNLTTMQWTSINLKYRLQWLITTATTRAWKSSICPFSPTLTSILQFRRSRFGNLHLSRASILIQVPKTQPLMPFISRIICIRGTTPARTTILWINMLTPWDRGGCMYLGRMRLGWWSIQLWAMMMIATRVIMKVMRRRGTDEERGRSSPPPMNRNKTRGTFNTLSYKTLIWFSLLHPYT